MKKFHIVILLLISITASFSQSFQWGKRGGSAETLDTNTGHRDEEAYSIVTDSNKNIYMLSSVGTANLNFDGHPDTTYADPVSKTETALVSFACDGSFRWSKIIGGGGFEEFRNVVIDAEDNVYIAGTFGAISDTSDGQHIDDDVAFSTAPPDYHRLTIIKFNSNGVLQWYKRPQPDNVMNETYQSASKGLQIGSDGTLHWLVAIPPGVYANGAFTNPDNTHQWFVFKYDGNGDFTGATTLELQTPTSFQSAQFFRNPYNGNYFFSARSSSGSGPNWAIVGTETVTHSTFISCYDPTGQALWKRENTSTSDGYLVFFDLAFDTDNNIYLAGRLVGFNLDSFMGLTIADANIPAFIMKLDAMANNAIWTTRHNKGAGDHGALILNGSELGFTDYCAGNDFTWGTQILNASSTNEGTRVLFARFDKTTGDCLSLTKIPGTLGYNSYGCALAVDASNDYIIGGNFSGSLTFDGGAQITNVGGPSDFFITKYATSACSPLAVQQYQSESNLKLYPNPANTFIQMDVKENTTFKITNVLGQEVKTGNISPQANQINIQSFKNGVYLITLESKGKRQSVKFLKQ